MGTNNALNNGLSSATGTGSFVGSTSATLVTPTLGAATATSLVFSPTTGGVVGTTTNDNAGSGKVGEFISSVIPVGSAVSLTDATAADVTSISLTAGDWDVYGNVFFTASGNTLKNCLCWISSTSATIPNVSLINEINFGASTGGNNGLQSPYLRFSLSGTTTVYLSSRSGFDSGTMTACGGIYARRAR